MLRGPSRLGRAARDTPSLRKLWEQASKTPQEAAPHYPPPHRLEWRGVPEGSHRGRRALTELGTHLPHHRHTRTLGVPTATSFPPPLSR